MTDFGVPGRLIPSEAYADIWRESPITSLRFTLFGFEVLFTQSFEYDVCTGQPTGSTIPSQHIRWMFSFECCDSCNTGEKQYIGFVQVLKRISKKGRKWWEVRSQSSVILQEDSYFTSLEGDASCPTPSRFTTCFQRDPFSGCFVDPEDLSVFDTLTTISDLSSFVDYLISEAFIIEGSKNDFYLFSQDFNGCLAMDPCLTGPPGWYAQVYYRGNPYFDPFFLTEPRCLPFEQEIGEVFEEFLNFIIIQVSNLLFTLGSLIPGGTLVGNAIKLLLSVQPDLFDEVDVQLILCPCPEDYECIPECGCVPPCEPGYSRQGCDCVPECPPDSPGYCERLGRCLEENEDPPPGGCNDPECPVGFSYDPDSGECVDRREWTSYRVLTSLEFCTTASGAPTCLEPVLDTTTGEWVCVQTNGFPGGTTCDGSSQLAPVGIWQPSGPDFTCQFPYIVSTQGLSVNRSEMEFPNTVCVSGVFGTQTFTVVGRWEGCPIIGDPPFNRFSLTRDGSFGVSLCPGSGTYQSYSVAIVLENTATGERFELPGISGGAGSPPSGGQGGGGCIDCTDDSNEEPFCYYSVVVSLTLSLNLPIFRYPDSNGDMQPVFGVEVISYPIREFVLIGPLSGLAVQVTTELTEAGISLALDVGVDAVVSTLFPVAGAVIASLVDFGIGIQSTRLQCYDP